jgi:transcription antitermination factor NusG
MHTIRTEMGSPGAASRSWYVARTKRHRERAVEVRLRRDGLATYVPLLHQWPPPAVGAEIGAMFPCYVFVCAAMPFDFHRISRTPGVHSLVTFSASEPAPLDASAIDFLRSREGPDGVIRARLLEVGRRVRVVGGPLRGFDAVVECRLNARQRVRVLLDMLQRRTRVELPEKWLGQA